MLRTSTNSKGDIMAEEQGNPEIGMQADSLEAAEAQQTDTGSSDFSHDSKMKLMVE